MSASEPPPRLASQPTPMPCVGWEAYGRYVVIALLFGMIVLRVWAGGSRDGGESAAAAIDSGAGWEKARKH